MAIIWFDIKLNGSEEKREIGELFWESENS